MLIGIYGLILEFFSPGAVAPGLVGVISLLLALYAFALLPINYAGVALVLFGIGLMVAEAHIGAFGALGVGGIAAFVIGALMMFPSRAPGFALSDAVVAGAAIVSAGLLVLVIAVMLRSRKRPVVTGDEALLGAKGEAVSWQGADGPSEDQRRNLAGARRGAAHGRGRCKGHQPRWPCSFRSAIPTG